MPIIEAYISDAKINLCTGNIIDTSHIVAGTPTCHKCGKIAYEGVFDGEGSKKQWCIPCYKEFVKGG